VATPQSLLARATSDGLMALASELRAHERDDAQCARYRRVKPYDDVSAVLLTVHG